MGASKEMAFMAGENIVEFTDQNFEQEVLKSPIPVLVDFWAEWCMPCRMLAPTIEKLATQYAGKVKVGKVDTDSNRDTALKFSISNIPTVILFKDGQAAQRFVCLRPKRISRQCWTKREKSKPALGNLLVPILLTARRFD